MEDYLQTVELDQKIRHAKEKRNLNRAISLALFIQAAGFVLALLCLGLYFFLAAKNASWFLFIPLLIITGVLQVWFLAGSPKLLNACKVLIEKLSK